MQQKLRQARDHVKTAYYDKASDILTAIIFNPSASFAEKETFQKIILLSVNKALEYISKKARQRTGTTTADLSTIMNEDDMQYAPPSAQYWPEGMMSASFGYGRGMYPVSYMESSVAYPVRPTVMQRSFAGGMTAREYGMVNENDANA
eukprot:TRINITY_DN3764_c0_g5_i1.p1 TRINITY_DN3764_c0_g5~~TRINITY_DN3764_c0_g5_i1.p1  ORF type:complete len:148 (-),score=33.24 TRINITY_DN3764_c0_g5_i1:242-685(-)